MSPPGGLLQGWAAGRKVLLPALARKRLVPMEEGEEDEQGARKVRCQDRPSWAAAAEGMAELRISSSESMM